MLDNTKPIDEHSKEELVQALSEIDQVKKDLDAEKTIICERLFEIMTQKSEVVGEYIISQVTKQILKKPSLDWAQERGCIKSDVDMDMYKKLIKAGAAVGEFTESKYILLKPVGEDD